MESGGSTNCWSRSCIFKVCLFVFSLVIFAAILITLISWKKRPSKPLFKGNERQQARSIQENMDRSVDPCKKFFDFTCGNYKTEDVGVPNWISTSNALLYQRYLESVLSNTQKFILPAENLRAFHNACRNIYSSKKNCKDDLKNVLIELQWPPLTKNWNSVAAGFNWLNLEKKLIKMGFTNSLITFTSASVSDEILVCGCAPSTVLFDITNEEETKGSIEYLIEILEGEAKLANEILPIFIEIEKIKQGKTSQKMLFRNTSESFPTLGDLEEIWKINFVKFCISIFPSYMNITKSTKVTFKNDCPFRLVDFLMQSSKRSIAGYMLIQGIAEFAYLKWITADSAKKINRQNKKLFHDLSVEDEDPDKKCYDLNMKLLPDLWYYVYVKTYSSKARKDKVLKMLNLILDEGKALINSSWLSDPSKKVIFNKFSKLIFMVDHDEEFVTDKYVQSTFGDLKFNASDMIKSVMHLKAHRFLRQWKIFTVSFEKREIFRQHSALDVKAYNQRLLNVIIVPAPAITPILYSDDGEDSLNFGGLGSILAHEIFHTIDKTSLEYEDKHIFRPWLNEQDKLLFDDKINCFVKQYSNYRLTSKLHVDGHHTLDETLADSGIILTYRAYLRWLETNKVVKKLPGLDNNYNNRQMFWIAFGNLWCARYNKEYLESVPVKIDIHTIEKFRVLGTLSNLEEFSKDFNCPADSDMNPKKKCKLYH